MDVYAKQIARRSSGGSYSHAVYLSSPNKADLTRTILINTFFTGTSFVRDIWRGAFPLYRGRADPSMGG